MSDEGQGERAPIASNFVRVLFAPRQTMERLLADPRTPVIPLVLLAALSSNVKPGMRVALARSHPLSVSHPWIYPAIACAIIVGALLCLLLFYGFAWLVRMIGRAFEAEGDGRSVRLALAWGLMPVIAALFYRVPMAIWYSGPLKEAFTIGSHSVNVGATVANGCVSAALLGVVELLVIVWTLVVTGGTLSVALRVSPLSALGILLLAMLAPLVVVIAAVLASHS
jgi:hypothetical protein